jgi:capsular exopolysaccharide synthesis family protein
VITAPEQRAPFVPGPGTVRAAHTLILANNTLAPEDTEKPLNVYALFIRVGEVPKLAAERLGYTKEAFELVRSANVQARPNVLVGTLTITSGDRDPERAALIADTFADSLKTVLADQTTQRRQLQIDSQLKAAERIQAQINDINRQIATAPDAGTVAGLEARREPLQVRVDRAINQVDIIQNRPDPLPALLTLESGSIRGGRTDLSRYLAARAAADFKPEPRRIRALIGLLIGLLVGAAVSFAIDFFDPRLRTRAKVEDLLGLPVVAEIPLLSRRARRVPGILAFNRPLSPLAEGYRVLRTALLRMPTRVFSETPANPEAPNGHTDVEAVAPSGVGEWRPVGETNGPTPKVVLVCSPRPREGKTLTVANLAVCLAESGHTVLVLDSDLRAPQAHKLFGVQVEPGLSDVLSGSPDAPSLADVAQDTKVPGVQVIAAGSRVANPGRLLARAADLVREARHLADFVLIDTAPTLIVNDAIDFMPEVDCVIPVLKSGSTTNDAAFRMGELLVRMGARVLGIVLVGVPSSRRVRSPYGRPPQYQLNLPSWSSPADRGTRRAAAKAKTAKKRAAKKKEPAKIGPDTGNASANAPSSSNAVAEPDPRAARPGSRAGEGRPRLRWSWSAGADDFLGREGPA